MKKIYGFFAYLSIILNFFYLEVILENKSERKYFLEKTLLYLIGSSIGYLLAEIRMIYNIPFKYNILFVIFLFFLGIRLYYKNRITLKPSLVEGEAPSLPPEKIYMERKKDMKNEYSFELPNYSEKYLETAGRSIDESLGLPNKYEM